MEQCRVPSLASEKNKWSLPSSRLNSSRLASSESPDMRLLVSPCNGDSGKELRDFMVHITQQVAYLCKQQVIQGSLLQQVQEYQLRAWQKQAQELQKLMRLQQAAQGPALDEKYIGPTDGTTSKSEDPQTQTFPSGGAQEAVLQEVLSELQRRRESLIPKVQEERADEMLAVLKNNGYEKQEKLQEESEPLPETLEQVKIVEPQGEAANASSCATREMTNVSSCALNDSKDTACQKQICPDPPATQDFIGMQHHKSVLKRKVDVDISSADSTTLEKNLSKLDRLSRFTVSFSSDEKQTWHERLRQEVTGYRWECIFGALIIFNTCCMSGELQYVGYKAGYSIGFPEINKPPDWGESMFLVLNDLFLVIFIMEVIVKMAVLRSQFWRSWWDIIDFLVVLFGAVGRFADVFADIDPTMLRLVRLFRLIRFMKMFKVAGSLHAMNLILKSVAASRGTLFWSMLLLFMVQWLAGMFVGQMTQSFLMDEGNDPDARYAVYRYYGTFTKTQFTMFEVTHVNYSKAARVLVDHITEWWAWFFIIYRSTIAFAFLQVIRSVFIQTTLKVAERDKDLVIHNKRNAMRELHKKLGDIFRLLDSDGSGRMQREEFIEELEKDSTKIWLNALDVDVSDPEGLFALLDLNGTGDISFHDFTFGAAKLRGPANQRDVLEMQAVTERMEAKLDTLLPASLRGQLFPVPIAEVKKLEEETKAEEAEDAEEDEMEKVVVTHDSSSSFMKRISKVSSGMVGE
jgi:hypothetical protein